MKAKHNERSGLAEAPDEDSEEDGRSKRQRRRFRHKVKPRYRIRKYRE